MRIKPVLLHLVLFGFLLGFCNYAFAHKVNLFCYFEDGFLNGEGYYSGGRPAQNAGIEIYSLKDNELITKTATDAKGKFKIKLSDGGSVKVVMSAGQGHRCEFTVEQERRAPVESSAPHEDKEVKKIEIGHLEIERLIEQKIRPLEMRVMELEKQRSEPDLITVIGGIGFIIGIFSLVYFVKKKHAS